MLSHSIEIPCRSPHNAPVYSRYSHVRETGGKVGSKEKPLVFLSSLSLLNDDSYTSVIVPMKRSRGKKVDQQVGGASLLEF